MSLVLRSQTNKHRNHYQVYRFFTDYEDAALKRYYEATTIIAEATTR